MFTPFTGNGYYCFTNSLHMVLQGHHAENLPGTYFIECLTTMPFGNTYLSFEDSPIIFFSGPNIDPDKGISLALETLGWEAEEYYGESGEHALGKLRTALKSGPVLAGPMDFGHLTYNPNHKNLTGVDHYVVVLDMNDESVLLHDPAGYPCATLPVRDFVSSWKAENIVYKRGSYTFRYNFKQIMNVNRQEMIHKTLERILINISFNPDGPVEYGSTTALRFFSDTLKKTVPPRLEAHLIWFALPLAARRAIDAARFFHEANMQKCADIHLEKAKLFGKANYCAVKKNWTEVGRIVDLLIKREEELVFELKRAIKKPII